jgi:hypothetical protein
VVFGSTVSVNAPLKRVSSPSPARMVRSIASMAIRVVDVADVESCRRIAPTLTSRQC